MRWFDTHPSTNQAQCAATPLIDQQAKIPSTVTIKIHINIIHMSHRRAQHCPILTGHSDMQPGKEKMTNHNAEVLLD